MRNEISLRTWIERFNNGDFEAKDVAVQIEAGWYDWFCKDSSLANKTKLMGNIIKLFKDGGRISLFLHYVWFKNNYPLDGPLYDDFRIAEIETNDTVFTVRINNLREETRYSIYGKLNDFAKPLYITDSVKSLVAWFDENCI